MSTCSENARAVADVLKNVKSSFKINWTDEDISSVSNKIACNFLGEIPEILNIALARPIFKRPDLELAYTNNNKVNDLGSTYGFKLTGLPEVNTITFETLFVDPNVEQGIKNQHFVERIHLVNLDVTKNTAADHLIAEADYTEESTSTVSSSDYAYYLVTGANGIFDGAKRVKIVFNKDRTRNVSVMF